MIRFQLLHPLAIFNPATFQAATEQGLDSQPFDGRVSTFGILEKGNAVAGIGIDPLFVVLPPSTVGGLILLCIAKPVFAVCGRPFFFVPFVTIVIPLPQFYGIRSLRCPVILIRPLSISYLFVFGTRSTSPT